MSEDFPQLRPDTRRMIEGHETRDVEFKESVSGVDPGDLVAFANASGGTILIGVREEVDTSGMQHGIIAGCAGSFDDIRNSIQSKARSCRPPVDVAVARECESTNHIYRVDIEVASEKPCCTGGGRYLIRQSGSTIPIDPAQITAMILEKEAKEFVKKLEEAGTKFVEDLKKGQAILSEQLESVEGIVQRALEAAQKALGAAEEATYAARDAAEAATDAAAFSEEAATGH